MAVRAKLGRSLPWLPGSVVGEGARSLGSPFPSPSLPPPPSTINSQVQADEPSIASIHGGGGAPANHGTCTTSVEGGKESSRSANVVLRAVFLQTSVEQEIEVSGGTFKEDLGDGGGVDHEFRIPLFLWL